MKKITISIVTAIILIACSNSTDRTSSSHMDSSANAADTTLQPNGITTGSVISTDTNSMKSAARDATDSTK